MPQSSSHASSWAQRNSISLLTQTEHSYLKSHTLVITYPGLHGIQYLLCTVGKMIRAPALPNLSAGTTGHLLEHIRKVNSRGLGKKKKSGKKCKKKIFFFSHLKFSTTLKLSSSEASAAEQHNLTLLSHLRKCQTGAVLPFCRKQKG